MDMSQDGFRGAINTKPSAQDWGGAARWMPSLSSSAPLLLRVRGLSVKRTSREQQNAARAWTARLSRCTLRRTHIDEVR